MIRNYLLLVLPTIFLLNINVSAQLPKDSIRLILQQEVQNKRSVGIAAGYITAQGKEVICAGQTALVNGKQPDGNTLFEIGSISKVFTSIILADMVLKKQVNLNDPISKYLPATVKTPQWNGKQITLLDLATHRSGLPRMPDNFAPKDENNPYTDYTAKELYAFLNNYTLPRDIGEKYEYSNLAVGLLGHILCLVNKSDYETLLKQRITSVLNMPSTVVNLSPELKKQMAIGHNEILAPVSNWDMAVLAGAGGIRSSVNDMLIFAAANAGITKSPLDSAIKFTQIFRNHAEIPEFDMGLGWHIFTYENNKYLNHNGGTGGFRTFIGVDRNKQIGVVVLSNAGNDVDDIGFHILNSNFVLEPYVYPWHIKDAMREQIKNKGIDSALAFYQNLKMEREGKYIFNEEQLNTLGYELIAEKKLKEAIALFQTNINDYSGSWNVYDSLGEAFMLNGDKDLAIEYYQISIELNPNNENGKAMVKKMQEGK
jgi:CubicO group peptidase (beta-lactamase class C family)